MKNAGSSIRYVYKNFLYVLFFTVIPAIFVGAFLQPFKLAGFVAQYKATSVNGLAQIFNMFFDFSLKNILNTIFASVLIIIFISAYLGNIEYHFRSGKTNFSQLSSYINNNFLAVTFYYVIVSLLFALYKILLMLFVFTFHVIFSGLGNSATVFTYIFAIVLVVLSFVLFVYAIGYFVLAVPITLSSGYSVRTALSDANDLMHKKTHSVVLSVILPIIFVFAFSVMSYLFHFSLLIDILGTFVLLAYLPILTYVTYYDFSLLQRHDTKKRYYYK